MELRHLNKATLHKLTNSELMRGMFIYSFGSLGSKAINLAIYPLLTFYLIKSELGYYDLIINTIYLVMPIATFQVSDGIFRFLLTSKLKEERVKIISNGIKLILYSTLIILSTLYLIINFEPSIIHGEFVFFMAFLFSINISTKQIVRGIKKNKNYVISDILYSFMFVFLLVLSLVVFGFGIKGVFYSFISANFISICYLWFSTNLFEYVEKNFNLNKSVCKDLLTYSLPLIPNSLSWWLVASANTWIIFLFIGLEGNGIYAIAFKFSSVIYLLNKIFSLAWQDKVILQSEGENKAYNSRVFNYLLFFLFSLAIIIILISRPILRFAVSVDYYEAWKYIPWLILGTVFANVSAYFGAFYLKWKKTNKIFITTLIGSGASVLLSLVLTKYFGLTGASLSIFLGFSLISILRYYDTKARLNLKFSPFLLIPLTLLFIVVILTYTL
ncbi:lipopolysaccharide biosynthesis protein [Psychroflexus lacisalsi]|uniref:Oligosaccharide flippase family protein n=1 Tax=Psychroflexus lacisalsi TaxID=503928 RepID=A0ABN1K042_9FLAO|nr:oligosaccharide flippase family protein [Psychroflexus lacisalsi]MBZ9620999.1 oligosaccharide flippase family protein [Psychroflexus lacisalsi]